MAGDLGANPLVMIRLSDQGGGSTPTLLGGLPVLCRRDGRVTGTLSTEPREWGDAGTQGRGVGGGACVPRGFAVVRCLVRLSVGSGESRPVDTEPAPSEEHLRGAEGQLPGGP